MITAIMTESSVLQDYNQKSRKEFMQISLEEIEYIAPGL